MGFANTMGAGPIELALIGMAVGTVAGFVNGWIITKFDIPAIVVTIGTMSLYRGIAYIVLGDDVYRSYPSDFAFFGQGYVWGVLSFEFVLFLGLSIVFGILLHKTTFGRRVYAIGNNPTAALFSGINVKRHRLFLFTLVGLFAGIAAVLLTSRIGSTRPSIAMGWELEVITMVVLGGVYFLGGAGPLCWCLHRGLLDGACHLWHGINERTGHCHVDLYRPSFDPCDWHTDHLAPDHDGAKNAIKHRGLRLWKRSPLKCSLTPVRQMNTKSAMMPSGRNFPRF